MKLFKNMLTNAAIVIEIHYYHTDMKLVAFNVFTM